MTISWTNFNAAEIDTSVASNDIKPIPSKTICDFMITDVKSEEYEGESFYVVEQTVNGGEYDKRKIWTKLKFQSEPEKANKYLAQILKATNQLELFQFTAEPTGDELDAKFQQLVGKCFSAEVAEWHIPEKDAAGNDIPNSGKSGNWIRDRFPMGSQATTATTATATPDAGAAKPAWAQTA